MPERTSYAHGVPSWVDVSSPDIDASAAFYNELFGWEHTLPGNPEQTGGYGMFTKGGKLVAGIGPLQDPEQPPVWSTYINVDDADDVVAKVQAAGGQMVVGPMDVMDAGRMAILIDPTGAFVGIWQPNLHTGAELVNEPDTLGWNELTTRDVGAAKEFYPAVFGWEVAPWTAGESEYTVWNVDGQAIGGLMEMDDQWPAGIPSHWMVYFMVADADATAAMTQELGGKVSIAPFDVAGVGRIAVLNDLHGTAFSVMTPATQPEP